MKSNLILWLLLLVVASAQAQHCNCKASFEWVKKTFEENDAGYAHILKQKGTAAYDIHNQLTLKKVAHVTDLDSCIGLMEDWVRFFRTDHFRFTKTAAAEKAPGYIADVDFEMPKQLKDSVEGVWEGPGYKVGIVKHGFYYSGVRLSDKSTRFMISADLKSATRMNGIKDDSVKIFRFWGANKQVLQLDNLFLRRTGAKPEKGADEYFRLKTSFAPYGYKRDSNTVYVRINSFNYENKHAIDSVLKSLHNEIIKTPSLVIDLRDCQGGSDGSFQQLIQYIYTNPIRSVLAEFYSTPRNNQIWKGLLEREGLDEEDKENYTKISALMDSKIGQYVNIFGKNVDITRREKVLPYPQSVGVIIHENNFSTTEEFILKAKQSKKVKFFGRKTGGALDVSNMIEAKDPDGNFIFEYCISRSLRIPEFPVDDMGLHPDFYLDQSIPETEWIDFTSTILNAK
jgi:C-terminal processing protease CtpA/Prc